MTWQTCLTGLASWLSIFNYFLLVEYQFRQGHVNDDLPNLRQNLEGNANECAKQPIPQPKCST